MGITSEDCTYYVWENDHKLEKHLKCTQNTIWTEF